MMIGYGAKYPQLVCVVLLLCIVRNAAKVCDSNNQTSATFENNLNVVVNNLVRNTSSPNYFNTSVYGQSPDRVYGLFQCYGGATVEECLSCSQEIANETRKSCENARSSNNVKDKCFFRYDNYSFFGIQESSRIVVYITLNVTDKPDMFRTAVKELFTNLSDGALQSPLRYSSGSTTTSTFYTIYSLVQCWRDLTSVEDCETCLTNAIRVLLYVTFTDTVTFQAGKIYGGSCLVRYDTNKFFNPSPPPPPSPIPLLSRPPIQQPPLSPPTLKKSPNKIGLVLGIVCGLLIVLLLCLFAFQRKFKSALLWMPALLRKGIFAAKIY